MHVMHILYNCVGTWKMYNLFPKVSKIEYTLCYVITYELLPWPFKKSQISREWRIMKPPKPRTELWCLIERIGSSESNIKSRSSELGRAELIFITLW
jgi:hypothetical protein